MIEWGVKPKKGPIEVIDDFAANEGYMTAKEAAIVRAEVIGGKVVSRERKMVTTAWVPFHSPFRSREKKRTP